MKKSPDSSVDEQFSIAVSDHQAGNLGSAIARYQAILQTDPNHHDTLVNLASALRKTGQTDQAIKLLTHASSIYPDSVHLNFNLGNIYWQRKNYRDAVTCYNNCYVSGFKHPALNKRLAICLREIKSYDLSLQQFKLAYSNDSSDIETANNLAEALIRFEAFDEAESILKNLVTTNPNLMAPIGNLANLYYRRNQYEDAIKQYKAALKIEPESSELHNAIAVAYLKAIDLDSANKHFQSAIELADDTTRIYSNTLYLKNYQENSSSEDVYSTHADWGKMTEKRIPETTFNDHDFSLGRPLAVGILSPDLHEHPVATFISPLYKNFDKEKIEIYSYADDYKYDDVSDSLKACSTQWTTVNHFTDDELVSKIKKDKIDIMIDLAGHTASNRMHLFAQRLAPVQIAYLGYTNTTGLSRMDYRIADKLVNPPDTRKFYTEQLLYLDCFSCYEPPGSTPEVSSSPADRNGFVTFGSGNNATKISTGCINLWSEILTRAPNTRLLLKSSQFHDAWICNKFIQLFQARGVAESRLIFEGPDSPKSAFLKVFSKIDLLLDTFPHNGGTTSNDAVLMGTPILALQGDTYVKRFGYQINTLIGDTEFIADSHQDYLNLAVNFAARLGESTDKRHSRSKAFLNSKLTDQSLHISQLQQLLQEVWKSHCNNKSTG